MSVHPALQRYLNAVTEMAASSAPLPVRFRETAAQVAPLRTDELPEEVREDHEAILAGFDGGPLDYREALVLIQRINSVMEALAHHRPSATNHLRDAGLVKPR